MAEVGGKIFVHREYEAGQEVLDMLGVPYVRSEKAVGNAYPADVSLNCFAAGGVFFGNLSAVSDEVKTYVAQQGFFLQNVKQGYTKCSTLVLERAIITADRGIYTAAKQHGFDALLIQSGGIGIASYDTGFIGGASAVLDEKTVGFFGNLDGHPSGKEIRAFLKQRGVHTLSLSDEALFDYGGAVRIEIS